MMLYYSTDSTMQEAGRRKLFDRKMIVLFDKRIFIALYAAIILPKSHADQSCNIDGINCDKSDLVKLPDLHVKLSNENNIESQIFFIESSGRDHLLTRQACAVESALRNSKLSRIIVALTSPFLNISANNATNQLYKETYSNGKLSFLHIDVDQLFKATPLQELHEQNKVETLTKVHDESLTKDLIKSVHYSDAIRLVLVYKYGGFYSDLDMVILKPLTKFRNVLSCDENGSEEYKDVEDQPEDFLGKKVSNAIFHFEKEHVFVEQCLQSFASNFDGKWGSGGPDLFQKSLNAICQMYDSDEYLSSNKFSPQKCEGVSILKYNSFYPFGWNQAPLLFGQRSAADWSKAFADSYSVHFYASSFQNRKKILKPNYYGKEVPAYAYLGPIHCPLSFFSEKNF